LETLISHVNLKNGKFIERTHEYKKLIKDYRSRLETLMKGGSVDSIKKHRQREKNLPRERINLLIDKNSPFLELSTFAACDRYNNEFPSAGIVSGIGYIHGREAVIVANDATVKGGTYVKETIRKHLRAQEIAMINNLPCVYLVDSGGIFLPEQANVFADKDDFGRIFFNQARMSARGIAQIAVVLGSSTAGGAYVPAMSDEVIIVKDQGTIFLGGPPLVKAATGEDVSSEELGGGELHARESGVADHLAENEEHALAICRDIFSTLPSPDKQALDVTQAEDPLFDPEELYGLLPLSTRDVVDAKEIIARLVDRSEFHEFKKFYGTTLITGFARIMGFPVGIIANNGILFSESALKGTHFIELCNFRKIPLIFLQNITGFMVGKSYESSGIAKDGAKMVHAVATANVPKFTVIFGGSYGAGNYAMAGRAYEPNLLFLFPNSRTAVMGGEQAANVLASVKVDQAAKKGKKLSEQEIDDIKNPIMEKYEHEGSAYYSSSRLWDDGIIDPVDIRKVLAIGISASQNKRFLNPERGIYRM
jgi:acetyl-CoA carboxylase carboxyltransferase component